eukprot:gene10719-11900_t
MAKFDRLQQLYEKVTTKTSSLMSTPPTSPTPSTTPSTTTSTTTTTTPSPFPLLPDIYEDLSPNKDQSLLKYKLRIGKGKNGYPLQHDEVEIGYRIYGRNHSLLFDSMEYEMENKEFFRCHLNMQPSEILPGWEIALKTMFEGEKSMYYLASQHAFGPAGGLPPFIRADEDVYCELTLHKIIPSLARQYGTVREGEDIKQELVNQIMRGVTSKHHFTVKLLPNEIVIRRREEEGKEGEGEGEVILSGPLHGRIVPSECSWAVEDGEKQQVGEEGIGKVLVLHLEKAHGHRDIWATVFSRSYLRKKAKEEKKRLESTLQQGQGDEGGIKKEEEDDDEEEEEE